MNELVEKTKQWFHDKGLADGNPSIQMLKLFEEFGELAEGLEEGNEEKIADALGDMQVVLIGIIVQTKYEVFIPVLSEEEIQAGIRTQHLLIFIKEVGKLAEGLAKEKPFLVLEALTDLQLTMIRLNAQFGYTSKETLEIAYNEIKDRTGKVKNGNFIKVIDL